VAANTQLKCENAYLHGRLDQASSMGAMCGGFFNQMMPSFAGAFLGNCAANFMRSMPFSMFGNPFLRMM